MAHGERDAPEKHGKEQEAHASPGVEGSMATDPALRLFEIDRPPAVGDAAVPVQEPEPTGLAAHGRHGQGRRCCVARITTRRDRASGLQRVQTRIVVFTQPAREPACWLVQDSTRFRRA